MNTSSQNALKFSSDTLTFDTVFQSLGSATKAVKLYNPTDDIFIIDKVALGNPGSKFRFNIDGYTSQNAQGITILPNDSLWVYIEVTIDPSNPSKDILVTDDLIVSYNGGTEVLVLEAFGQDVYLHNGEIINFNTTWFADKPHVIIEKEENGGILPGVYVAKNATLTISEGATLHFNSSAGLLVEGKLVSKGTKDNKILMRGIRLEESFIRAAGQWLGVLIFRESRGNEIEYTTIDESAFGVWLGYQLETDFGKMTNATRAEVTIKNTTIANAFYWATRSMNNDFYAENSEFYTCSDIMMQFFMGGNVSLINCTTLNIQSLESKPNMILSNEFYDQGTATTYNNDFEKILIQNTVFNSNTSESMLIELNNISEAVTAFENCLYNSNSNFTKNYFLDCIIESDPKFRSITIDAEDLSLNDDSPCIDKGANNTLTTDLLGNMRPSGNGIDIGAFEFQ